MQYYMYAHTKIVSITILLARYMNIYVRICTFAIIYIIYIIYTFSAFVLIFNSFLIFPYIGKKNLIKKPRYLRMCINVKTKQIMHEGKNICVCMAYVCMYVCICLFMYADMYCIYSYIDITISYHMKYSS